MKNSKKETNKKVSEKIVNIKLSGERKKISGNLFSNINKKNNQPKVKVGQKITGKISYKKRSRDIN